MSLNLHNLFKNLKTLEPSEGLEGKILQRVALKRSRQIKRNLAFVYAGFLLSFGAFLYTVFSSGNALLRSEFMDLAKLVFSDGGVIASHGGDFALSLLETFPVMDMVAILIPIFAVMLLLSLYLKLVNKTNYNYTKNICVH